MSRINFGGREDAYAPVRRHVSVLLSDAQSLPGYVRGIKVCGSGTIRLRLQEDDTPVTYADGELAPGVIHPMEVKQIFSSGTTVDEADIKLYA